jgi:hypothetical protein
METVEYRQEDIAIIQAAWRRLLFASRYFGEHLAEELIEVVAAEHACGAQTIAAKAIIMRRGLELYFKNMGARDIATAGDPTCRIIGALIICKILAGEQDEKVHSSLISDMQKAITLHELIIAAALDRVARAGEARPEEDRAPVGMTKLEALDRVAVITARPGNEGDQEEEEEEFYPVRFKVWLYLEAIDERDRSEDLHSFDLGEFDNAGEALWFIDRLKLVKGEA